MADEIFHRYKIKAKTIKREKKDVFSVVVCVCVFFYCRFHFSWCTIFSAFVIQFSRKVWHDEIRNRRRKTHWLSIPCPRTHWLDKNSSTYVFPYTSEPLRIIVTNTETSPKERYIKMFVFFFQVLWICAQGEKTLFKYCEFTKCFLAF